MAPCPVPTLPDTSAASGSADAGAVVGA